MGEPPYLSPVDFTRKSIDETTEGIENYKRFKRLGGIGMVYCQKSDKIPDHSSSGTIKAEVIMQIKFTSVVVDNQEKALHFYTTVLGLVKMADIPMGQYRWLTVVSPEGVEGVELVLEPMGFPPARTYQKALYDAGIPAFAFISKDIQAEYERLKILGVIFRGEPTKAGMINTVLFEDTCGNLINLVQPVG
jgi:catechol 2,3-dioxygenase-like lactoylglutathione lyase family enzyme